MSKAEWGHYDVHEDEGGPAVDPNVSISSIKGPSLIRDEDKAPSTLLAIWGLSDMVALVRNEFL